MTYNEDSLLSIGDKAYHRKLNKILKLIKIKMNRDIEYVFYDNNETEIIIYGNGNLKHLCRPIEGD